MTGLRGAAWLGLLALAIPTAGAGQGAGASASTLLRVAPGPRPLALGGAGVALTGPLALEYNPAGTTPGRISGAYQSLPVDAVAGAASLGVPVGPAVLGVSLRFLDYGEIDVVEPRRDLPVGVPTGEVATGGELSALVAGAVRAGPLRLGLAARWFRMDVAGLSDDAFAADAGALLDAGGGVTVGASIQGLGSEVEAGRSAPLLRTARVGAALSRRVGGVSALVTAEARHREGRTGGAVGLELGAGTGRVEGTVRGGYETRPDPGDVFAPLVFGGGVRIDRIEVDFAYRGLGPLGSTTQLGLSYRF